MWRERPCRRPLRHRRCWFYRIECTIPAELGAKNRGGLGPEPPAPSSLPGLCDHRIEKRISRPNREANVRMTTISRRVVLQGSYAAAAMLGAAKFANARDLASLNVTESAARLASQDLPCGKLRDEIFYRVDWLGAPWINPEPILLI